jgi:hypothetical protein
MRDLKMNKLACHPLVNPQLRKRPFNLFCLQPLNGKSECRVSNAVREGLDGPINGWGVRGKPHRPMEIGRKFTGVKSRRIKTRF